MIHLKIKKKRLHKETDKAYVFLTTVYNGEFFSIPKSLVKNVTMDDDWIGFNVDGWLYNRISKKLDRLTDCEKQVTL